ncbi:MAG: GldG family protein [Roseburia sp.]|nr:GldG family protein [Roseburia sp.]
MKDIKKSFKSRKFRMGGYQTLIMVIVIVLVIVFNLVVNKLNLTVDLSSDQKFTLTEETKKLAEGIGDTIKFYYMCEEGNQSTQIEKVLEQYDGLGNIEVVDKDPVVYPNFAKEYTEDEIGDNDVIVVNESRNNKSRVVSSSDMLVQDFDYATYQQTYTLDAEGQLTAALQNVTSDSTKKMYYTSGHGEGELNASFTDILGKSNIDYEEFATSSAKSVPEDCNILLVNAPEYDMNEDEYAVLSDYLKEGGKAMFFLNAAVTEPLTNYYKLISDYGVNVVDGYIIDSEGAYNERYPTMFIPVPAEHEITEEVSDKMVVVSVAKGMTTQSDVRSTLTVEPLLMTADSAYSKVNVKTQTVEKEEGDVNGPFNVAVAIKDAYAENTKGEGKATQIVVYGSGDFSSSDVIATNQFGNRSMILNSLSYLSGEETTTLAIPTRSLNQESVMIQEGDRIFFTVLLVVLIPLILLGVGFAIWFRRRKN